MAENQPQNKAKLISETRRKFESDYVTDKSDKYDPRDIERLQQDDNWVESYLNWRHNVVDETVKMLDESFQWRKEFSVNDLSESSIPRWLLEMGGIYLHGYDKEGNKLFWIRVKYHVKDQKTIMDKKKLIAFWLERYAKRENGKPVTVMFDLSETGLNSIDMDFVRFIINCFKVYYPKYLSKIVIFDMPWIMNAAFKIVKSWLGPEAVSLLKFTGKHDIQDYVSVEYLPPHMGGTDPFKYSYPPLVDDDFQTPLCENGPITSEDETSSKEDIESDGKETLETISNEEQIPPLKKVSSTESTSKTDETEKADSKNKSFKKPLSVFKGPLLHISPAEELYFGSTDSGEKKTLIVLTNVTKNTVAFKVRTTAPEKYRVKPSNSSCDPGASVDIVLSPHGGLTVSAQDRFLIMAAEMEQPSGTGPAELTQFWKEVPRNKVVEHRLRCHIVESNKPNTLTLKDNAFNMSDKTSEDLHLQKIGPMETRVGTDTSVQKQTSASLHL
ncbi:motile sperm domain-containing protein 2 isoform X2 [Perognathus longimembris pacificus]|uniref:motile sperm domain-containing protein 2 isoform X2 n=1 Tax=Perognathus longimembris pacificus TaxID=214514 RepID=UPI00201941F6|nr:motile sperm domain-containing protein 2 isoform X2 [Perognathus longimembris pacificus]XP_048191932.1 motile sperm domain-containing protein 2 isoform X2 [Perognathus longimembris pacificus]